MAEQAGEVRLIFDLFSTLFYNLSLLPGCSSRPTKQLDFVLEKVNILTEFRF